MKWASMKTLILENKPSIIKNRMVYLIQKILMKNSSVLLMDMDII